MSVQVSEIKRQCYACGSETTYCNASGSPIWYLNHGTPFVLCGSCYSSLKIAPLHPKRTMIERLWSKVKTPVGIGECWEWLAAKDRHGYGKFWNGEMSVFVHRFIYEQIIGSVHEESDLDHLCRNPGCVNPYHLEPVTHKENVMRGIGIATRNAKKTHCPKGHLLEGDNLVPNRLKRG